MSKKTILKALSANTLQVISNQLLGLLIFFLMTRFLSKEAYGELSWTIALLSVLIVIIGLGMEQIIVRRVATGENVHHAGGIFILHTLLSGILFFSIIMLTKMLFPAFFEKHLVFTGIALSLILTYWSSPFKQIANGLERFSPYSIMMLVASLSKSILLLLYINTNHELTLYSVVRIFIFSSLIEYISGGLILFFGMNIKVWPFWNKSLYKDLVGESLPQLGVLIFDSALARIDWILLGIFAGPIITADYAFAYRVFELSRLPMLILAPVILSKFSRYFSGKNRDGELTKEEELNLLVRIESVISVIIPLLLNIAWIPLVTFISDNKYGVSNESTYLLLSLAIPVHYLTNFLWTMAFAQKQIKLTFYITIAVSASNIMLNLILIPVFKANGAALAFVLSTIIQVILYKKYVMQNRFSVSVYPFVVCLTMAAIGFAMQKYFSLGLGWGIIIAVLFLTAGIYFLKLIRLEDFRLLVNLLKR